MIEYKFNLDSSEYFTIFSRPGYSTNTFLKKAMLINPKVLYTKNFERYIEENPGEMEIWGMVKSNPSELMKFLEENPDEMRLWEEVESNPSEELEYFFSDTRALYGFEEEEKKVFEIMIAKGFYQEIETDGEQNKKYFTELVQSICAKELELEKTGNDNHSFDSIIRVLIARAPLESVSYLLEKNPNLMNLRGIQEICENCQEPSTKKSLALIMAKAKYDKAQAEYDKAKAEYDKAQAEYDKTQAEYDEPEGK